ncbi:DUF2207 domain-containing protein [Cryobacterium sp. TMT2-18-3]|nr:DUF2207 domain-containing protein [Cryobacterium sp. TMT2-18-2]TFC65422.1 DUF2207 domain-containing protein [Cryobacterium sp. TMT2-18-3]
MRAARPVRPAFAVAGPVRAPSAVSAGVEDFTFDSWHSDFRLLLTGDGHSRLTTTETIVARFPETDQNRGILRAIPTHYDGHPTDLELVSVTDENGRQRDVETETTSEDGGDQFLAVTIATDGSVHGAQTYVITYEQVDVTLDPEDASIQEFYREVNGTGWAQSFGAVSATLTVDSVVAPRLTGDAACHQGTGDSSEPCASLTTDAVGEAVTIDVTAGALGPAEGLTLAVGFEPGTFVPRDQSFTANPFPGIGLAAALIGLLGAGLAVVSRATRWRNAPGRPTVVAEYLRPRGVNLLVAGNVMRTSARAMTAQLLSFAVRGNVRVLEGEGTKHYLLELLHTRDLDPAEEAVLRLLFPGQPGQVLKLYEDLLPFAVLFGQEKEWAQVLGDYYARSDAQPDWYAESAPFNPVWFAAGLSSFTSSTSASWSGSASSSSSSGSGGGGSVGGGGGGGGGGGV